MYGIRIDPTRGPTASRLQLIRSAILSALVVLGVAAVVIGRGTHDPATVAYWSFQKWMALMLAAMALACIVSFRWQRRSAPASQLRNSQALTASSVAALVPGLGVLMVAHGAPPLVWIGGVLLYLAVGRALPGDDLPGRLPRRQPAR